MIAALYVDPRGPYPKIPGVDCWDIARDARLYDGPHPVVAHPPCGPWGRLRHLYRGNEHDCAPRAVEQVRRWGGVLEHPAWSRLWDALGMPRPGELPDYAGGYTVEVDQCAWGHVARKRTWLYCVGVPLHVMVSGIRSGGTPTHWIGGFRLRDGGRPIHAKRGASIPVGIKACSAQQRRRTPPAFAEWLVSLAAAARQERAA